MNIGKISKKNSQIITTDDVIIKPSNIVDNYTKLSILVALAAYKKTNSIFLDDKFNKINLKFLGKFMSYVVNHPNSPKKFEFKIEQNTNKRLNNDKKDNILYDVILSFSGGIDSTAGLLYCLDNKLNVLPLWVNFGQKNKKAEEKSLNFVLEKLKIKSFLKTEVGLEKQILKGWKDWDFIVPARNFIFAAMSNSIFKNSNNSKGKIFICAIKEEMRKWKHRDKSKYFFETSSRIFSKDSGKNIKLCSPFEKYSKTEVLYWWKNNWEKKYGISPHDTSTCYYNLKGACGKCRACFRRTISLLAAGYEVDENLQVNPLTDPVGFIKNIWIPEIIVGKISRSGKLDFYIAMEKSKNILPPYLLQYYNNLPWQTIKAISKRKKEILSVKLK